MKALSTLEANLRCADVTGGLAGEEEELTKLVERLDKAIQPTAWKNSAQKTKLMTKQQHRNQSKWTEALSCHQLQVPVHTHNC